MKAQFKSNKTFEDAKSGNDRAPRVTDLVDVLQFPANEWVSLRFVGPTVSYGIHWIETLNKQQKKTSFPKVCLAYDDKTEELDSTRECPWCEADSEKIRFSPEYYSNAIVRSLQEEEPSKLKEPTKKEAKTGFKEKGSKTWTPVRAVRLTRTLIRELKKLSSLNRAKDKKTGESKSFPLSHPKYGCDIQIMYDPNEKTPAKKYMVQKGERTALTSEEQEYLLWSIEGMQEPDSLKDSTKDFERWAEKMDDGGKKNKKKGKGKDDEDEEDDDEDEDEEDEPKKGKGKKGAPPKKGNKKKDDDDEDDDEDDEDDVSDDDDDEDEKPAKGKKGGKKSKASDDDDDEDDDDDDEDEDEDEPKKGKGKKPAAKGKGKKSSKDDDDDDEDDDEDDLDEDDEDEKPKKGAKASKGKKSSKDDDDDEDDDEDDEDEKPTKKGKKPVKGKGKKSSKDDEDDEEDDEDEDLDDDDEDEKPAKKGKGKKPAAKKGKKSKSDDDDDEDDEDEDEDEDDDD